MKLRIKTHSSQFTPANTEGYELLQKLQGEGEGEGEEGVAEEDKAAEDMDTSTTVAGIASETPLK